MVQTVSIILSAGGRILDSLQRLPVPSESAGALGSHGSAFERHGTMTARWHTLQPAQSPLDPWSFAPYRMRTEARCSNFTFVARTLFTNDGQSKAR